ncbi:MAG: hypothetical protein ACTS8A_03835 [Arsenophonus sp. ET-LJ4-MAG3]
MVSVIQMHGEVVSFLNDTVDNLQHFKYYHICGHLCVLLVCMLCYNQYFIIQYGKNNFLLCK